MKRLLLQLVGLGTTLLLMLAPSAVAQSTIDYSDYNIYGWGIQNFHSDIVIHQDSSFTTTETIVADFTQANGRHGIYRYIPIHYKDRLQQNLDLKFHLISVKDGTGRDLTTQTSWEGNNVSLKIGDADTYVDGKVVTYVITYQLSRGLNQFDDHAELYWNVTGNGWDNAIVKASATIVLPKSVDQSQLKSICYTGFGYSKGQDCQATIIDGKTFQFSTNNLLPSNAGLTIVASFPKDTVTFPGIITYLIWFLNDNWGYLIPILVFLILYYRWHLYGRDPKALHATVMPEYDPPDGLRPAEVGTLIDDRVDTQDITSTIIDLATRGWLKIIETEKKVLFGHSYQYELQKLFPDGSKDQLNNFEKIIYDKIFDTGEKVNLDDLKYSFYTAIPSIKETIYKNLVDKKYYSSDPDKARNGYITFGAAGLMLCFFFAGLLATLNSSLIFGIFVSLVMIIIFGFYMPKKTQLGADTLIHILGLEEFIKTAEKDRMKFYEKENIFEKLLPYAIALGLAEKWTKTCEGLMKTAPDWYQSSSNINTFNAYYFINNLNSFSNTLSSNMETAPRSSASGGSSGFGGGGFSGGGFGGGGGGSW